MAIPQLFFLFLFFIIYLFSFSSTGSLLLPGLFSGCESRGLLSSCSARASQCGGFSCGGAGVPGCSGFSSCSTQAQSLQLLVSGAQAQWHVESSWSGIKLVSPALAGRFFIIESPGKPFGPFFSFGHTVQYMGSLFPNQWLNPCPLQWKQVILTPGPPGKSPYTTIVNPSPCWTFGVLVYYESNYYEHSVQVFRRQLFSFLLNKYFRMKWLGHRVDVCLISLKTAKQLSKEMIPFYSPNVWNSICFMFSPTLDIASVWF